MGEAPGKGSGKRHPPFSKEQASEYGKRSALKRAEAAGTLAERLRMRKEALGIPDKEPALNKAQIEQLAKEYAPSAVHTLVEIASDPEDSRAVVAANALLDRAYGKAKQAVDVAGADGAPLSLAVQFVSSDKPKAAE